MDTEVKCEFTEFADVSKKDITAETESEYHGIRSKEEMNRIVKTFRTSNSLGKAIKISQMS